MGTLPPHRRRPRGPVAAPSLVLLAVLAISLACAPAPRHRSGPGPGETYLRWVAWEEPVAGEFFIVRWRRERMPLKVHLPFPPAGLFPDAGAVHDAVKDAVFDWTDVAGPGVPRFVLVDTPGEADIPIVWAERPDGDWYVAHSVLRPSSRIDFGVDQVLVTGRWNDDRLASLPDVRAAMLHEMGHALGLVGHSPDPGDIMYPQVQGDRGLSERDRATLAELYRLPIGRRVVGGRRSR